MAFITVDDVKQWLDIDMGDPSKDAMIQQMIDATTDMIERYLNRKVEKATFTETHNGDDKLTIFIRNPPIISITSVTVNGVAIPAASSFTANGYRFDQRQVVLNGYVFHKGFANCTVVYEGGFDPIPDEIIMASKIAVQAAYTGRTVDPNIQSESVPGVYSASYRFGQGAYTMPGMGPMTFLPPQAQMMLGPLRRMSMS